MSIARRLLVPVCAAVSCVACAGASAAPPRVYTPVPTRADAVGPVVPPVYVHLVGSEDSTLMRATDDGWTNVCAFPCDGYVPAFGSYRVAVVDRPSRAFTLPAPPGTWVSLRVDDDAKVWTHDSVQLSAARAQHSAPIVV
ncbi:MAG: hypothetical protein ACRELY_11665, partial [Polyangiaceae bacterium]